MVGQKRQKTKDVSIYIKVSLFLTSKTKWSLFLWPVSMYGMVVGGLFQKDTNLQWSNVPLAVNNLQSYGVSTFFTDIGTF